MISIRYIRIHISLFNSCHINPEGAISAYLLNLRYDLLLVAMLS
jgi:hypothetical protein